MIYPKTFFLTKENDSYIVSICVDDITEKFSFEKTNLKNFMDNLRDSLSDCCDLVLDNITRHFIETVYEDGIRELSMVDDGVFVIRCENDYEQGISHRVIKNCCMILHPRKGFKTPEICL